MDTSRILNLLKQIDTTTKDISYGPTPQAGSTPSAGTIMSAGIQEQENPRGIWQILAQAARLRGQGQLAQLAAANATRGQANAQTEFESKQQTEQTDRDYKNALMQQIQDQTARFGRNDDFEQALKRFNILRESEGSPVGVSESPATGTDIASKIDEPAGTSQVNGITVPNPKPMRSPISQAQKYENPEVDIPGVGPMRPPTASEDAARKMNAAITTELYKPTVIPEGGVLAIPAVGKIFQGQPKTEPEKMLFQSLVNKAMGRGTQVDDFIIEAGAKWKNIGKTDMDNAIKAMMLSLDQEKLQAAEDRNAAEPTQADVDAVIAQLSHKNEFGESNPLTAPSLIPGGFGTRSLKARVMAQFARQFPETSVQQIEQDYKYTSNYNTQTRVRAINALDDSLGVVEDSFKKLGNWPFRSLNEVRNRIKTEFGDASVRGFDAVATSVSDELGQILQNGGGGSAGVSDYKLQQAQKFFNNQDSQLQFSEVLDVLRQMVEIKKHSITAGTNLDDRNKPGANPNKLPAPGTTFPVKLPNGTIIYGTMPATPKGPGQ